jgi:hypothetical protein
MLLEQLVTSLWSSTTLWQVVNKPLTTCQRAEKKQCEHILLTSCWNSIATSLLQVCYNLCVFTCVVMTTPNSFSVTTRDNRIYLEHRETYLKYKTIELFFVIHPDSSKLYLALCCDVSCLQTPSSRRCQYSLVLR